MCLNNQSATEYKRKFLGEIWARLVFCESTCQKTHQWKTVGYFQPNTVESCCSVGSHRIVLSHTLKGPFDWQVLEEADRSCRWRRSICCRATGLYICPTGTLCLCVCCVLSWLISFTHTHTHTHLDSLCACSLQWKCS